MRRFARLVLGCALLGVTLLGTLGACEQLAPNDVGKGLGTSCQNDDQCQASKCVNGLCAITCPARCPSGTTCAAGLCQVPLEGGFMYPGLVMQEDYTRSFDLGRVDAGNALPYASLSFVENVFLASDVDASATMFAAQGRNVIIGAQSFPSYGPLLTAFADKHPQTTLLIAGSRVTRPNLVSFDTRTYQAYYLAGVAAGLKTTTHRLGMIGSTYSPSTIASINAFALGAQSISPTNKVELKWIGDRHDPNPPVAGTDTRERSFTKALIADGADVIAHTLDNNISVATIRDVAPPGVFAVGGDVSDACDIAPTRCVGSVFYNWGPLLTRLIDGVHKQSLPPNNRTLESIQVNPIDSAIGFSVSDQIVGSTAIAQQVDGVLTKLASDQGVGRVFDGPIHSVACEQQKNVTVCVPSGSRLDDAGLDSMCWLVDGIVSDAANTPATVPMDPNQDCGAPPPVGG